MSELIAKCMTVGELREALDGYDDGVPVKVDHEGVEIDNVHVRDLGNELVVY